MTARRPRGWGSARVVLGALVLAALAGGGPVRAQAFPAPGEGAYTWERVGDKPVDSESLFFRSDGALVSVADSLDVLPTGATVWQSVGSPRFSSAVFVRDDGVILSGNRVIDRSTDGGQTWTRTCASDLNGCRGPERANAFLELPSGHAHAGRVLAGARNYSDDRGLTWTTAPYDGPTDEALKIGDFALLPSGRVLAAADGWGFLSSDDGGSSWQVSSVYRPYQYAGYGVTALATPGSVQSGAPSCGLADLSLCDGAIAIGTDAFDAFNRVWWTNEGGRTWTQGEPLEQVYDGVAWGFVGGVFDRGLDPETGLGRAVAVLGRGFVFTTRDGGQTWDVVARVPVKDPDLGAKSVRTAVVGPDGRLYAAISYNGPDREWVYRTQEPVDAAFAVAGEAEPAPSGEVGVSVRPNPAVSRAEVRVALAEAGRVRVALYDVLGRRVAVLLDGERAAGEHALPLDAGRLAPGVYVVRVEAGASRASRRVTVVR